MTPKKDKKKRKRVISIEYDEDFGFVFKTEDGKELVLKYYYDASGAMCGSFVEELSHN